MNNQLKAINLTDFINYQLPPREYLLEPILIKQGLAMIYAYRGVGKTHVALNIAFAVASGGSLFDNWRAPNPNRVLYIDGEMPANSLQERLKQITATSSYADFDSDNLILLTNDLQEFGLPDLATVNGQLAIRPFTEQADLIILDNISTLCRSGEENNADDWRTVQEWALRLRAEGKSVLFIHHAGKAGSQRGTSKREDTLDLVISLRHSPGYLANEGARFEVHFEKNRGLSGEQVKPFVASLSTKDGEV